MLYVLSVIILFVVSFAVNYTMLNAQIAPPGADYGNYLTQVDILQGNDLRGLGLRHQPLFFVFLDLLMNFFDELPALKFAASLVFSIIVFPFFLVAKKLSHNSFAALISTVLFVFFISYAEMIMWGGNPNFLAFSFLLLALFFIIDVIKHPSKSNIILSGLCLSLIIGTHVLVAIFTFGALIVYSFLHLIFIRTTKEQIKNELKKPLQIALAVFLFSLPYISFYITFFKNSSSEMVTFRLLDLQVTSVSILDSWVLFSQFSIIIALTIASISGLRYCLRENRSIGLLTSSLLLAPLILLLITTQPLRWVYFLPIPLLLCFSVFLDHLFHNINQAKKATIILFAALFIATIAIQSTYLTGTHLETASNFYQFIGKDEVKAFDWIKSNTPPEAIFATSGYFKNVGGGGNSYAWWVEGYSNRLCKFTGDIDYYSFQFERNDVRAVNNIFAGTYVIDHGNLKIAESFPASINNPKIAVFVNNKYEDLLTISDAENQIYLAIPEDQETMLITPFYSQNRISSISQSDSSANITVTQQHPKFELIRSVTMNEENSYIDIRYQVEPNNSSLKTLEINLKALSEISTEDCHIHDQSVSMVSQDSSKNEVTTLITIEKTNGKLNGVTVFFPNPKSSKPVVSYVFQPTQEHFYVNFRLYVDSPDSEIDNQRIRVYPSYALLEDLKIDYIILNKNRPDEYTRFLSDSNHFKVEYYNDSILIFKVSQQPENKIWFAQTQLNP